jgi:hypothetical protein
MSDQSLQNKCVKLEDFIDYYDDAIKYSDFKYNTTNMLKEEEKKRFKEWLVSEEICRYPKDTYSSTLPNPYPYGIVSYIVSKIDKSNQKICVDDAEKLKLKIIGFHGFHDRINKITQSPSSGGKRHKRSGHKRSGHKRSGHKRSGHKRSGHKRSGHKRSGHKRSEQ